MEVDEEALIAQRREQRKALMEKLKPLTEPEPANEEQPPIEDAPQTNQKTADEINETAKSVEEDDSDSSESLSSDSSGLSDQESDRALLLKQKLQEEKEKLRGRHPNGSDILWKKINQK